MLIAPAAPAPAPIAIIENIANNQYSIVIVADLSEPSLLSDLERFGKVKVVTVEDLYPY